MRLGDFIVANLEAILTQWETFARSIGAGAGMEPVALRDHAEMILRAAVRDMASQQTQAQQSAKSKGRGHGGAASDRLDDASGVHALERVESGFDVMEVVSEYRALRASVIRLWRESHPTPDARDLEDLTRFNESIDQSLTQAIGSYTRRVNESRERFLAILGHDLRSPLSAVHMLATMLARDPRLDPELAAAAGRILHNTGAIARLVTDLLEFTRTRLGSGMPVSPVRMDLTALCRDVLAEFRVAHPTRTLRFHGDREVSGQWDPARLRQVITNLIANAIHHGSDAGAVDVTVEAEPGDGGSGDGSAVLTIHNEGPPIPREALPTLFDPMVRWTSADVHAYRQAGSLGLGLYIVHQIVTAHGGRVAVESSAAEGTTFTVRLPRPRP